MPGPSTIYTGETATKLHRERLVYVFDWDADTLAEGVQISTSSFTVEKISGSAGPALTSDQAVIQSGNRSTRVRLSGGAAGSVYRITNQIVTDEAPAQTMAQAFVLRVQ